MRLALTGLAVALSAAFTMSSASAVEIQCAGHKQMIGLLAKKYKEEPMAMGTVNSDRFMQLFVSPGGTWTILVTKTDGQACIVAAGQNWEKMPDNLAKSGPSA